MEKVQNEISNEVVGEIDQNKSKKQAHEMKSKEEFIKDVNFAIECRLVLKMNLAAAAKAGHISVNTLKK